MKLNLSHIIAQANEHAQAKLIGSVAPGAKNKEEVAALAAEQLEVTETLKALMTSHRSNVPQRFGVTRADGKKFLESWERGTDSRSPLDMNEALASNDAQILFKRVVSDILMLPKEQEYIGQTLLAKKIKIDGARSARFPAFGAIRAFDLSEGADYPEQTAGFSEHMLELKVQKSGLKIAINEEVIQDSMWDIFGLYVTMISAALDRHKEEKVFNEALNKAITVFDNSINNDAYITQGRDASNNANGSIDFRDLMVLFGGVLANGYTPTDLLLHPLAWVMLARDPRLMFQLLTRANYNQSVPMPDLTAAGMQKNMPFGNINLVVTPQMRFVDNAVLNLLGTNLPASNLTDIVCIDRQASLLILQREEKSMDEFVHQDRDVHMVKASERYAVGALDQGRGMTSIKNIVLTENLRPVFNVGMGNVS